MNITQRQQDIIVGTLLGDGYLNSNGKTAHLELKQSAEKKEYVFWLYQELKELCTTAPRQRRDNNQWYVNTRCLSELVPAHTSFYLQRIKIVPRNIESMLVNPLSIAVWYMDDGTLDWRVKDHYAYRLTTNSFTIEDNEKLVDLLKNNFNVDSTVQTTLIRGKRYPRIHIGVKGRSQFHDLVKPYIRNCFKHKLPPITSYYVNPSET